VADPVDLLPGARNVLPGQVVFPTRTQIRTIGSVTTSHDDRERIPHEWIDPADLGFPKLKGMSCRKCGTMKPRDEEQAAMPRCRGWAKIGLR
jgi:hypothetical protein